MIPLLLYLLGAAAMIFCSGIPDQKDAPSRGQALIILLWPAIVVILLGCLVWIIVEETFLR